MKTIGQVYQLKETLTEIKSELTPSFDEVIKSYLGKHVRTKFKDPNYVTQITWPTPPLQIFTKRVLDGLSAPTVQGTYLIRGFGFGKSHAIILLWHLLNSKEASTSQLAKTFGMKETLAKETLAVGIDFSSKEHPFAQLFEQLNAIAKREQEQWDIKDPKLTQAVIDTTQKMTQSQAVALSSEDLAELIVKTAERYRELGGNPKIALLVDELGIGIITRLTTYIEKDKSESYSEIERTINFIEQLYTKLNGKGIPAFFIIALAEQDLREIDSIYLQQADKPKIQDKIDGLRKHLSILRERLSRATGGLAEEAALSYDPEHAINIAKHRVFKPQHEGDKPEEALLSYLTLQAQQYNLEDTLESYKEQIRTYYPLSPSLIWLFKKILSPTDVPRTEYVRTTLFVLAEAAETALKFEPDKALTVSTKHIPLARAGAIDLMGDFEAEWASTISDMEHALSATDPKIQKTAGIIARQILAKGTTANVTMLLEIRDPKELKRYGVSTQEIQIDMLSTLPSEEANKSISQLEDSIEYLKTQSARVEEKEHDQQKFYMPSLMRTIYDKLAAFVMEQKRVLEEPARLPSYIQQANLTSLFYNPKASIRSRENEVTVLLKEYNTVSNIEELINNEDIRTSQREGTLAIAAVPPWDAFLFNELYQRKTDYHTLVTTIAQKLQALNLAGKISHPMHLIILMPNVNPEKFSRLIEDVISYAAVKEFLNHLQNKTRILEEKMVDYERTIQRRLTLRLTEFFEEQRKKLEIGLKNSLDRQVRDARTSAQRELVKLTRRIATSAVELYEDAIFFSMQSQNFLSQSLIKLFGELGGEASRIEQDGKDSLSDYSLIINKFFERVIYLTGFAYNPTDISDAIFKHYKFEIQSGVIRKQDRISEIIENAMLGTFDIKPLSSQAVKEAIEKLHNKIIETENRRITLKINQKESTITFEIEETKPPEIEEKKPPTEPTEIEIPPAPGTAVPVEKVMTEVLIEIDPAFNYEDFKNKLEMLYKTYGTLISSVKLSTSSNLLRATFDFLGGAHSSSTIVNVSRFIRQVSNPYKATPYITIKFTNPLPQDKLKEILGTFAESKVRRSWDTLLSG
ncbi:MAG: hypothetical protein ACPLKZ_02410 [Candidatus Bathyarchaeales archaeon]